MGLTGRMRKKLSGFITEEGISLKGYKLTDYITTIQYYLGHIGNRAQQDSYDLQEEVSMDETDSYFYDDIIANIEGDEESADPFTFIAIGLAVKAGDMSLNSDDIFSMILDYKYVDDYGNYEDLDETQIGQLQALCNSGVNYAHAVDEYVGKNFVYREDDPAGVTGYGY
tara:strand:- start:835 stop:1341 length:507 start_codon:yes stop_codon:yes gene_type:complete